MGTPSTESSPPQDPRPLKSIDDEPSTRPGTRSKTPALAGCQVETPASLVEFVWQLIEDRRNEVAKVIDLGAGDGRFAASGFFDEYVGYEIDKEKHPESPPHPRAEIRHECVLNADGTFDIAIGNPPYIRNQDIDPAWRTAASEVIESETGVKIHGLSNLYIYFLWLALLRTQPNGLVSLVVPYEWVARPAAAHLRDFLEDKGWEVSVYELDGETSFFPEVKTTASVSIIDKARSDGGFSYYRVTEQLETVEQPGPSGKQRIFPYERRDNDLFARRGYSLGSQAVFALTEKERQDAEIGMEDVVPCVASLRGVEEETGVLDDDTFQRHFVSKDRKSWILDMSKDDLSPQVEAWLDKAPDAVKENTTCSQRDPWYRYKMPEVPDLIYSVGFTGTRPTFLRNEIEANILGGAHGIYAGDDSLDLQKLTGFLRKIDFSDGIVPHSGGLRKIGVGQMNGILQRFFKSRTNHSE